MSDYRPKAERHGRKGKGDIRLRLADGTVIYLSAYEVRLAYRALYSERPRRKATESEEQDEIEKHLAGVIA